MAMVVDDDEWTTDLDGNDEPTDLPPDHVFDLPDLFDDLPDGFDAVIDADQSFSAESTDAITTTLDAAYLAGTQETRSAEVDLYDSGTTRHMTGFFHRLFNYVETDLVPIVTADKRSFHAVGKGDMYVYLPNRDKSTSRILLKDVLYSPKMGVTLVSISRIAGAGSTVVFTGNVCRIYTKNKEVIGEIKVENTIGGMRYSTTPQHGKFLDRLTFG